MAKGRQNVPGVRELAVQLLTQLEEKKAYSQLLLNNALDRYALERNDAALLTELVYGTVQRMNTLDYFLNYRLKQGVGKLQVWVRQLLRISLYQILYLDKIPDHAAVNEAVNIAKRKGHRGVAGLVNGVLRNILRNRHELTVPLSLPLVKRIALEYSHPDWLVSRWIEQYGEDVTAAMCAANLQVPSFNVRVNPLKSSREDMLQNLLNSGYEVEESVISPQALRIVRGGNLAHTDWFKNGELSIQDESSMLPVELLAPQPGMKVLDVCAAPGGKTTQMAELMEDQGTVWANDVHPHKERLIAEQTQRLGLKSIRTSVHDARQIDQHFERGFFDAILLDAPCSGFGVIRRKPDLKWNKQESEINEIAKLQFEMLQAAAALVRPGGTLVYSTCTLEKRENEDNVMRFLAENKQWELDDEKPARIPTTVWESCEVAPGILRVFPHTFASDGFFMARLKKK